MLETLCSLFKKGMKWVVGTIVNFPINSIPFEWVPIWRPLRHGCRSESDDVEGNRVKPHK